MSTQKYAIFVYDSCKVQTEKGKELQKQRVPGEFSLEEAHRYPFPAERDSMDICPINAGIVGPSEFSIRIDPRCRA